MRIDLLSEDKVVITVAITGGIHGKWANPNLPITAEEQAQDVLECYEAGASIVHVHVRGEDGQNTPDLKYYNKTIKLIEEKCPIIKQIGNGIGAWLETTTRTMKSGRKLVHSEIVQPTLEDRLNLLNIYPPPEMHTINAGTFQFRTQYGSITFENPMEFNRKYINRCKKKGFGIEIEVYDSSHIANILELVDEGYLLPPLHFSIVLGIKGGAPATIENLINLVHQIPEGSTWQVVTVGKFNLRTTLIAMCMGANVRTGLEDTIYYQKGELVQSNAQLVKRMVRLAKEIGKEPATVDEAKSILGLK
ncbi:MAG: 3-keto-5-aminohexanoate cleavage protein [Candidatus Heimdallarchaeota archaeon]